MDARRKSECQQGSTSASKTVNFLNNINSNNRSKSTTISSRKNNKTRSRKGEYISADSKLVPNYGFNHFQGSNNNAQEDEYSKF